MFRLFSYKMTHDSGFAPNPFWGELTLATCKPQIRLYKKPGDWIAGFTSLHLCGDPAGQEKLVFLMKAEQKLTIAQYFQCPRYKSKIPDPKHSLHVYRVGDNIYKPRSDGAFEQISNPGHDCGDVEHDLSGKFVLTASEFVYFGGEAIAIPEEIRPDVPAGQSGQGSRTSNQVLAQQLVEHIFSNYRLGVQASPHTWPAGDSSWKQVCE